MKTKNKNTQSHNLIPFEQLILSEHQGRFLNNQSLLTIGSISHKKIGKVQRLSTESLPHKQVDTKKVTIQNLLKQKLITQPNPQRKSGETQKRQIIKIFHDSLIFKKGNIAPEIKSAKETIDYDQQRQSMKWSGHQFYRKVYTAIQKQSKHKYQTLEGFYRYQQKKHRKTQYRLATHDLNEQSHIKQVEKQNKKIATRSQSLKRFQRHPSYQIKTCRKNTTPYWEDYEQALKLNQTKHRQKKQDQRKKRIESIINSSQEINKKTKSELLFFFQSKNNNSMNYVKRDKNIMKMRKIKNIKSIKSITSLVNKKITI